MSSTPPTPRSEDHLQSIRAWEILERIPDARFPAQAQLAAHVANATAGLIALARPGGYDIVGAFGFDPRDIPHENAFCSHVLAMAAAPLLVEDAQVDLRFSTDRLVTGPVGIRFCVAAPLLGADGQVAGAVCALDRRPRRMSEADLDRFAEFAGGLSDALMLRQNVTALCNAALRDPVTGLGNRTFFECQMDSAIASAGRSDSLAVLCVNIDRLQSVNTMFGHAGGDTLLRTVASRISGAVADAVAIARIGADEFAVLLRGVQNPAEVTAIADRLIEGFAEPVTISGQQIEVSTATGCALYPEDGNNPLLLLERAHATLAEAKRDGKGGHRRFEPAIERDNADRQALEADLRRALENDTLFLYWQPIADSLTRQPVGYEALLRWERPGHGPIPPSQFIAAAEECGLSGILDAYVLKKACREAAAWPDTSLRASVNVSSNRVRFGDLSDSVAAALEASGLAPNRLEIEITERVLMEDEAAVRASLESLRALGVRIALDDFGTGFSSLSYLRSLPLDKLKLDRTFTRDLVNDPQAREVARTVVRLGRVLGLIVLAEGVETEDQLSCLRVMGCDEVQGYLLGWPRPIVPGSETQAAQPRQRSALRAAASA